MDQYEVDIRLPRNGDPDPNLVVVSGKNEDRVYDCIDYLRQIEEELMEEVAERSMYMAPRREETKEVEAPKAVIIQGAPWNPGQGAGEDNFPSLAGEAGATNGNVPAFGAWGRRH
jgi:hypothetical protein